MTNTKNMTKYDKYDRVAALTMMVEPLLNILKVDFSIANGKITK